MTRPPYISIFFFFNDTATTEIYTLSLHDALPILSAFPAREEKKAIVFPSEDQAGWKSDRKSTRLNSSHLVISYAVFCLKKKKHTYLASTVPNGRTSRRSLRRFVSRIVSSRL